MQLVKNKGKAIFTAAFDIFGVDLTFVLTVSNFLVVVIIENKTNSTVQEDFNCFEKQNKKLLTLLHMNYF